MNKQAFFGALAVIIGAIITLWINSYFGENYNYMKNFAIGLGMVGFGLAYLAWKS